MTHECARVASLPLEVHRGRTEMSGREAWSRKVVKAAEAARRVAMSPILVYNWAAWSVSQRPHALMTGHGQPAHIIAKAPPMRKE